MPIAKKLPSGSWRCRIYDYVDGEGKSHYRSFTAPTKKEAERLALEYTRTNVCGDLTFGEAMTEYIANRERTLSPRTISSYKSLQKNYYQDIKDKDIRQITQADIQREVNIDSGRLSPKTVRGIHGFLVAVMYTYRPDFQIRTALPKAVRTQITIPTEKDIHALLDAVRGTEMELPVLLSAFGPMRRGEICALRAEDVRGNVVHVCRNKVKKSHDDGTSEWIVKSPKSYAGDRFIEYPDFVRDVWRRTGIKKGEFVSFQPDALTNRFIRVLKTYRLPHFRFHDLRHYSASIQHALGVPDAYIMQRGGWGNDGVLKEVYRHALEEHAHEQNQKINSYFTSVYDLP